MGVALDELGLFVAWFRVVYLVLYFHVKTTYEKAHQSLLKQRVVF